MSSWEAGGGGGGCKAARRQAGLLWTFSLWGRGSLEWPASHVWHWHVPLGGCGFPSQSFARW